MEHLILDCETMSPDAKECAVIDFSAFIFTTEQMTSDNPYSLDTYKDVKKFKLSVSDQREQYKYKVDKSTKQFWLEQSKQAQSFVLPTPNDLTLVQFGKQFTDFLNTRTSTKFDRWWTRSNTFDPVIIWRIFSDLGMEKTFHDICPHWQLRDTRSFIDGALSFPKQNGFTPISNEELWKQNFVHHDSSWDVLADVLRIQAIVRSQQGLTI